MLFYFSATGITKKLAETLARRVEERACNIEELLDRNETEFTLANGERLGFLCPVHFGNIPDIVVRFIERLRIHTAENYYCFVALTFGGDPFAAPNRMVSLLLRRGLTTNAVFGLKGIDTFIPFYTVPTGEERKKIDARTALETSFMAEQVADRTEGTHIKRGPFPRVTTFMCMPLYKIMRKTSNFAVSDKCTGCGLCAKNCPEKAIELDEAAHRPKWISTTCMICMRCLHRCPAEAIDYGKSSRGKTRLRTF